MTQRISLSLMLSLSHSPPSCFTRSIHNTIPFSYGLICFHPPIYHPHCIPFLPPSRILSVSSLPVPLTHVRTIPFGAPDSFLSFALVSLYLSIVIVGVGMPFRGVLRYFHCCDSDLSFLVPSHPHPGLPGPINLLFMTLHPPSRA